mmetsp:Transcript_7519/g.17537  ORF Transcript_7519/g.17537 Transcript_7519/m.17537 type:complete len:277 (-) Transcript_7519:59-889(-)
MPSFPHPFPLPHPQFLHKAGSHSRSARRQGHISTLQPPGPQSHPLKKLLLFLPLQQSRVQCQPFFTQEQFALVHWPTCLQGKNECFLSFDFFLFTTLQATGPLSMHKPQLNTKQCGQKCRQSKSGRERTTSESEAMILVEPVSRDAVLVLLLVVLRRHLRRRLHIPRLEVEHVAAVVPRLGLGEAGPAVDDLLVGHLVVSVVNVHCFFFSFRSLLPGGPSPSGVVGVLDFSPDGQNGGKLRSDFLPSPVLVRFANARDREETPSKLSSSRPDCRRQ